jgi:hypothetical protein
MTGPCRACLDEGRTGCGGCQAHASLPRVSVCGNPGDGCGYWCSHCNGYGSSLKDDADRCSRCGGTGIAH